MEALSSFKLAPSLTLIIIAFATSCATVQTADPELRRAAANVEILSSYDVENSEYEIISEVVGISCATENAKHTREGAEQDMRIEAAKLNAQAVINVFCEEAGPSLRCTRRFECRGDAMQWK